MEDLCLVDSDDGAQITLPAILDLRAVEPLKAVFEEALAGGRPLTVDAEAVKRLSTPCIQVLIAAEAGTKAVKQPFRLARPSDAFIEKLRQDKAQAATLVLNLTTEWEDAMKAKGRVSGATGWIVKPFDPAKLVEVVRRVSH